MEELLRFGTKSIKKQYNRILEHKFPEPPEDDELYDLFSELVELDGYIMGLISSYLKNGEINTKLLECDEQFLELCSKIKNSSRELEEILNYKKELDKLISLFLN